MTAPIRISNLLERRAEGLFCPSGKFYIDPWGKVDRALVTHAHSDHAYPGSKAYLGASEGLGILKDRLHSPNRVEGLRYGEKMRIGAVMVSFHPAGHILGSAQIRIEGEGEICVITGDANATHTSLTCAPFEPVRCDVLITESTFGLPIYRWPDPAEVFEEIHHWWRKSQEQGRTCLLPAYPLGKSHRLLAALDPLIGPIAIHGNMKRYLKFYEAAGVRFPPHEVLSESNAKSFRGIGIVLHSSGGNEPSFFRKLEPISKGFASGWMQVRGMRRYRDLDRGFILSDHSDWAGLLKTVEASGAQQIGVTHGQLEVFSRYLKEQGKDAFVVPTRFESEG